MNEEIKKYADIKYNNKLWGYIEDENKIIFKVDNEVKEFNNKEELLEELKEEINKKYKS